MIADNDPGVLELVLTDLTLEGYDVLATAQSGAAAADACARHHPDVLIVDYRMPPGWNGIETIECIRREGTAGACILYTNYRSADIRRRTQRLGAVYLAKGPLWTLRSTLAEVRVSLPRVPEAG